MNQQSILFGYLVFGSLKKLIKQAELVNVISHYPYITVKVELPFELQDTVMTLLKEDLRGLIKKANYQIFEMVPQVAIDYAKHKNLRLDLLSDDPTITLIEFDHLLMQIVESCDVSRLDVDASFDVIDVKGYQQNRLYDLTFAIGEDIKNLKKLVKSSQDFNVINFFKKSGVLDVANQAFSQRGIDLFYFFTQLIQGELVRLGFKVLAENPEDVNEVITYQYGDLYEDPLCLDDLALESRYVRVKFDSSAKKINSCLKSLIKILKMMSFEFQLLIEGKFPENNLKEMTLGIEELAFFSADTKCLDLRLLDGFKRYKTFARFNVSKKNVECQINVLNLILTHVIVHKKLYPSHLVRPKQVAVYGDLGKCDSLYEVYLRSRLKGEAVFSLEANDLLSDKDALDYQIDKMIYFSVSDGMVKEKSYSLT